MECSYCVLFSSLCNFAFCFRIWYQLVHLGPEVEPGYAKRCQLKRLKIYHCFQTLSNFNGGGRTGLMVRASDSGSGDPGSILGRVGVFVSLSKRHLLPKSTGNTQE